MARPTRPAFFKQIKQLVQPIRKSGLESARTGPGTRGTRNPSEVHSDRKQKQKKHATPLWSELENRKQRGWRILEVPWKSRTRAHARVSARPPLRTYARAPARATRTHPRTHLVARRACALPARTHARAPPSHGCAPREHGCAPHAPCAHARAPPALTHACAARRTRAPRVRARAPRTYWGLVSAIKLIWRKRVRPLRWSRAQRFLKTWGAERRRFAA